MCCIYEHFVVGPKYGLLTKYVFTCYLCNAKNDPWNKWSEVFENYLALGGLLGWHLISVWICHG